MSITDKNITDLLVRCQYKYKDLAKRDIQAALGYFKELNLVLDKYVYPNGQAKDLVTLSGTIPVHYKNSRYNIPVQLFLSDTHPYTPPLSYVRPTAEMSVNVSEAVDSNGRVNLPCLREWSYPQSDIYVLLNLMTMKFSEQSPVFAKRQSQPPPSSNQPYPNSRPAYPSYNNSPYPSSNNTPYPSANNTPYPSSNNTPYPSSNNNPYPSANNTPYPSSGAYPSATNTPYPNNPYYPMPHVNSQQPQQNLSYLKSGSGTNIGNIRPASSQQLNKQYSEDTIKPEHYKLSIISAITDKANQRYFELASIKQAEIDSLRRVRTDLEESQSNLNNVITEVESEVLNMNNLTIELRNKTCQLNESVNQMQHRDSANIEDAVVTPAPLYRQLMQLFAEELAIQDFIFYLSEGLQNRTVNLDSFLKQVRFLSRKQFMLRATMQKAREKAALPL